MAISDVLKALMEANGLTGVDIERMTEGAVKQPTVSRLLSGKRGASPATLKIIADLFNISVRQLREEDALPKSVYAKYPAGPIPEGCPPEIWERVPERLDEAHLAVIATFADAFVRSATLTDPYDQRVLKEIYAAWLKRRQLLADGKKSEEVETNR